ILGLLPAVGPVFLPISPVILGTLCAIRAVFLAIACPVAAVFRDVFAVVHPVFARILAVIQVVVPSVVVHVGPAVPSVRAVIIGVVEGADRDPGRRITHHLQNHLPDPTTLLLMVGYQSRGSVGRALVEGAKEVRIAGRKVPVRGNTPLFGGLSGHAGQSDLIKWIGSLAPSRPRVILTHGEDGPRVALRDRIKEQ